MSTAQVMWWHRDDGGHTAILLGAGNKYLQVIVLDGTVQMPGRVPKSEERAMQPLTLRDREYPVKRAAKILLRAGKRFGIHKRALRILRELR